MTFEGKGLGKGASAERSSSDFFRKADEVYRQVGPDEDVWSALYAGFRAEIEREATWALPIEGFVHRRVSEYRDQIRVLEANRKRADSVYGMLRRVEFETDQAISGLLEGRGADAVRTLELNNDLLNSALMAVENKASDLATAGGRFGTVGELKDLVTDDLSRVMHRMRLFEDDQWWWQTREWVLRLIQEQAARQGYIPTWEELSALQEIELQLRTPPPLRATEVDYSGRKNGIHAPFAGRIARFVLYLVQKRGRQHSTASFDASRGVPKRIWTEAGNWHVKVHGHIIRSFREWDGTPPTRQRMRKYLNAFEWPSR